MIRYLINKLLGRKDESLLIKLKKALARYGDIRFSNKSDYYFVDNFIFERDEYSKFKELLNSNHHFYPLTKDWRKDIEKDNVEFYLINDLGKFFLLSLFDPYDYLDNCEILDIYEFKPDDINLNSLKTI